MPGRVSIRTAGAALAGRIPSRILVIALGAALFWGAALVRCPEVKAWELVKSTNGVVIQRSQDDTSTSDLWIQRYWGYKSGGYWSSTHNPIFTSSYNYGDSQTFSGGTGEAFEIALPDDYRCVLVRVSQDGQYRAFALLNESQRVSIEDTVTVTDAGHTENRQFLSVALGLLAFIGFFVGGQRAVTGS